jgi:hypothetical protein
MNTNKIIVKASVAKKGPVAGTGAGTPWAQKNATKISKPFVLRNDDLLKQYLHFDAKPGDTVCFLYC